MGIPIGITKQTFTAIKRELVKKQDFICMDQDAFIRVNLVGLYLAQRGITVQAKIVKRYAQ